MTRIALCLSAAIFASACDTDRFLSDKWILEQPEEGEELPFDATLAGCEPVVDSDGVTVDCGKWIELNLGHFGEQVVGTIRYYDRPNRVAAHETSCSQCQCQYINARFKNNRLTFSYLDCHGKNPREAVIRVEGSKLIWVLDPADEENTTIDLVQSGHLPTSRDKVCNACTE